MTQRRGAVVAVVALVLVGCTPSPTAAPSTPTTATAPTDGARLTVTGSGLLCSRWYEGCAAYLAVVDPEWTLASDWKPSADDATFQSGLVAGEESVEVTGVQHAGQERIRPGSHRLVVVKTTSPDAGPSVGTISASILCSLEVEISRDVATVIVAVAFDGTCSITMSTNGPTTAPSG